MSLKIILHKKTKIKNIKKITKLETKTFFDEFLKLRRSFLFSLRAWQRQKLRGCNKNLHINKSIDMNLVYTVVRFVVSFLLKINLKLGDFEKLKKIYRVTFKNVFC